MYYVVTDKNGENQRSLMAASPSAAAEFYAQLVFEDSSLVLDGVEVHVWREWQGRVEDEEVFFVEVQGPPEFTAKRKR